MEGRIVILFQIPNIDDQFVRCIGPKDQWRPTILFQLVTKTSLLPCLIALQGSGGLEIRVESSSYVKRVTQLGNEVWKLKVHSDWLNEAGSQMSKSLTLPHITNTFQQLQTTNDLPSSVSCSTTAQHTNIATHKVSPPMNFTSRMKFPNPWSRLGYPSTHTVIVQSRLFVRST